MTTIRRFRAILLILLLLGCTVVPVRAADEGPSFVVEPVYPDNQRSKVGYFDLLVEPGEQQELALLITNGGSADITVEVGVANASTSVNGFIDYTTPDIRDATMKHAFTELSSVPQRTVRVPAGGQARATVSVQAPDEPFEGMILGGIRVLKQPEGESDDMISNAYQYALAVALTQSEAVVPPHFELVDVSAGLQNGRATVTADIRNPQPTAGKNVDVTAHLYRDAGAEPLYSYAKTIDIAPNSVWSCQLVDDAGYGYPAGSYRLQMNLQLEEREWEFERDFVITSAEAYSINAGAVNQQQQVAAGVPVWVITLLVVGILLLLVFIILFFVMIRRRRMDG